MAMKGKLNGLRKLVGKLVASAPRPGQGAKWLAHWRLNDLAALVGEAIPMEQCGNCVQCHQAVALKFVVVKEAGRVGLADAPELTAALDSLDEAIARLQNPPRGTDWQGRELLKQAVITADVRLAGFLYKAVWRVPDDHSYPPGGRPPRLTELPPEWFPSEFNAQLAAIRAGNVGVPGDSTE